MQVELWQLDLEYSGLRIVEAGRQARLLSSLAEHGQQQPVLVVREGERYVLIDGYGRVSALGRLDRDTVDAVVLDMPRPQALALCLRLERGRVRSAIEEAWVIRELMREHAQREVACLLGRSASWVSRRLALIQKLPGSVEDAVRRGVVPAQAAMKYLVPLARANRAQCEHLVAALGGGRTSVRQLAVIYAGWRAGSATQRQRIAEQPLLYLEVEQKAVDSQGEAAMIDPGEQRERGLVRDLQSLSGISRRVRQSLGERDKQMPWPAALRLAWQQAQASFAALLEKVTGGA